MSARTGFLVALLLARAVSALGAGDAAPATPAEILFDHEGVLIGRIPSAIGKAKKAARTPS